MAEVARVLPTLHLLCGFVGADKTTFARRLEREIPAVRFSPDEWIVRLYGHNPPAETFRDDYWRVVGLTWQQAERLLALGLEVILDFGFWSRASRDEARARAASLGVAYKLYFVHCPEDVMRRRIKERSAEPADAVLWIDEAAFELFKTRFEPLAEDEEHVRIETGAG